MSYGDRDIGRYTGKRLSTGRDDRCDREKKHDDAVLRGKVGVHHANKIIKAIDEMKSWR